MAKVLFTAIVADMRNKLNGTVFSKNRYGAYTRTKVTPVNPQSADQQTVRGRFGAFSANWRGLSEADRISWINAAPAFPIIDIFGNSKILSGHALYNKVNLNLAQAGQAAITTAPSAVEMPSLVSLAIVPEGPGTLPMTAGITAVPAGFSCVVFATPTYGAGISFVKNKFRYLTTIAAAATLNPAVLGGIYVSKFGDMAVGDKVSVIAFLVNNTSGQAGVPFSATAFVQSP